MDLEAVKRSLVAPAEEILPTPAIDALPSKFYHAFILHGLRVDLIEPGRIICSMAVPPRLLNSSSFLHGGAIISLVDLIGSAVFYTVGGLTTGSPLEISIAYLDSTFVHMTNIGLKFYFLGIEVKQIKKDIFITQKLMQKKFSRNFKTEDCKSVGTLVECGIKLSKNNEGKGVEPTNFKSLRYLTCTRPDILYGVGHISRVWKSRPKHT